MDTKKFDLTMKKNEKNRKIIYIFVLCCSLIPFTCFADDRAYQIARMETPQTHFYSNDIVDVFVFYDVSDDNKYLTGIGVKIHFDPTILEYIDSQIFEYEAVVSKPAVITQCNSNELEIDSGSDACIVMGWLSTGSWPSSYFDLPLELMHLRFKVKQTVSYQSTALKIEDTSNTSGYDFKGIGKMVSINNPLPADININGHVDLADIILLLQHCSGFLN